MQTKLARQLMSTNLITIQPDVYLIEALEMMLKSNVSCLPVVDREDLLVGIISEYDIMNFALSGEADRTYVRDTMTKTVITFSPSDSLETIVNICMGKRVHRAPVVENGRLVGIISRRDILREMLALYRNQ